MPEQIVTQAVTYAPLISPLLLLLIAVLQLIHIRQTGRIHRRLAEAGRKLQNYLDIVLAEPEQESVGEEVEQMEVAPISAPGSIQSLQELNMRGSLEKRQKQKDEEQLLDSVLQEIFD